MFCEVHRNDEAESVGEQCYLNNERLDLKSSFEGHHKLLHEMLVWSAFADSSNTGICQESNWKQFQSKLSENIPAKALLVSM